jgi:Carbohydrate esterase 2 N-terminal
MSFLSRFSVILLLQYLGFSGMAYSTEFVPVNNPYIQYFGRWDVSDSLHPKHSWAGVYIYAEFSGSSIGVRMDDGVNYYNVYIDGKLHSIFHSSKGGENDYILADSLTNTHHTLRFSQRNISFGIYTFSGLLLSNVAKLYSPPSKPMRKIEFIGDSYTAAEGNEAKQEEMEWDAKFPVTNIDKGFAPIIARHFNAQYHATCSSGIGMTCDWQGNYDFSMRYYFDRTLMESSSPKWNFKQWIPNLVVICLGLNDHAGLSGKNSKVSDRNSEIFRNVYHEFIATVRMVYPGVPILAVAAQLEWIHKNVKQVVDEERAEGHQNVYYAEFGSYPGGYVANGHPNVETHRKIADIIIKAIDNLGIFHTKN